MCLILHNCRNAGTKQTGQKDICLLSSPIILRTYPPLFAFLSGK